MPFNLFPILWRLLLLRMNKLLNFHYFFRNFTCNSPTFTGKITKPAGAGAQKAAQVMAITMIIRLTAAATPYMTFFSPPRMVSCTARRSVNTKTNGAIHQNRSMISSKSSSMHVLSFDDKLASWFGRHWLSADNCDDTTAGVKCQPA